ncbi:MAG: hypothetical protein Q9227_001550 [Pyrenula ochraceoflavens]
MAATATDNAAAAADVQNVLAELKAGEASKRDAGTEAAKENVEPTTEAKQNGTIEDATKKATGESATSGEKKEHSGRGGRNARGGQRGRGKFFKGNRSDFSQLPDSDDPDEIRKQVEFYFSDSNLPQDQFLMSKTQGPENVPVDIELLCTFKRMRRFKPREAVVKALKESDFLDVVDVDDKPFVKRKVPLAATETNGTEIVKVFEDRAMPRSIYAKGFPDEQSTTQFDIEAFFSKFGTTNAIRLRRADDKTFKRSVFVEFDSEDTQKAFLALDPKPQYQGRDLQIMSKKAYVDQKAADIASGKIKPKSSFSNNKRKRGDDNEDTRDWRTRRDEDQRKDQKRGGKGGKGGRRDNDRGDHDEKDPETLAALAKARAAVEEQNKKEKEKDDTEAPAGESSKRKREEQDDGAAADVEDKPEKKVKIAEPEIEAATEVRTEVEDKSEKQAKVEDPKKEPIVTEPKTEAAGQAADSGDPPSKKRGREQEDDEKAEAPAAKKVDVKEGETS